MAIEADPKAIREFREEVISMNIFINNRLGELPYNIAMLGRTWKDEQFALFKRDVDKANAMLKAYSAQLSQLTDLLEAEAKGLEFLRRAGESS